MLVTLEHNLEMMNIERSYTTILDMLAAVGGLESTIKTLAYFIVSAFYSKALRDYLVA